MNHSLKDLESRLGELAPAGLTDAGRERCHAMIDSLVEGSRSPRMSRQAQYRRLTTAAAAVLALGLGVGGGWYLGVKDADRPEMRMAETERNDELNDFEQLDQRAWLVTRDSPNVYVTAEGEIREIFREVEVTEEVVQHRESGIVVTVETTDHHLVDSVKSEF